MTNPTLEKYQNELQQFKKTLLIIILFIGIIFGGLAYGLSYYNGKLSDEAKIVKKENSSIQIEIQDLQDKIENFLQGRRIEDLKKTEEALTNYFTSRLTVIPKVLILEFLEEITPPEIKYNSSLSLTKDNSITMSFFTKTIEEIGEYYYRLRYYEELGLLEITSFKKIELANPEKDQLKKYGIDEDTKYVFKTDISFKIKTDALKEYYNIILDKPEYINLIKDYIFIKDPIEPLTIPDNIGLEQVKKAHSILKERIEKERKKENKSKIEEDDEDNIDNIDEEYNNDNSENNISEEAEDTTNEKEKESE